MERDIERRIQLLRVELEKANDDYYLRNAPLLSDFEFDQKMRELQDLEKACPEYADENSPTQRVGSDLTKNFKQEKHHYPMLSLGNTYSEDEVRDFYERTAKALNEAFELVCELKFDGTSISLTYEQGRLVKALTRGDGEKGDNVTANVRTIRSIPLHLHGSDYPDYFEMRGEVLMPWTVFEKLNREREAQEEPLFANPRNAASGTLKLQNPAMVASRRLDAYLYYMMGESLPTESHYENLQRAKSWGFRISDAMRRCSSLEEVFDFIRYWDKERKNLPVATDGIVLKVNSLRQQKNLGYTAKSPRWAIAYKFQAERACTRLNTVSFQVGRTGAVTPVANMDPVQLSGTVVRRATLHNADVMNDLDLHYGDMVYVEKGGEIIPKIVGVDTASRKNRSVERIHFVKTCPECGTPLVRIEGEAAYYCPNTNGCPPQIKGKIVHFIHRKAMNIEGLGEETVDLLYRMGYVRKLSDLYALTMPQLAALERLGEKSAGNILYSIRQSLSVPFERVLFALGIRFVGETVAKKLAQSFHGMDALQQADEEQLKSVDEIGEKIAGSLKAYFSNPDNLALVEELKAIGLQMEVSGESLQGRTELLAGKTIVISGVFVHHSRDEYKAIIEKNGGKNAGSVSSKTDFILAGENMGPAKLEKARSLGVALLGEEEFLALLNAEKVAPETPSVSETYVMRNLFDDLNA